MLSFDKSAQHVQRAVVTQGLAEQGIIATYELGTSAYQLQANYNPMAQLVFQARLDAVVGRGNFIHDNFARAFHFRCGFNRFILQAMHFLFGLYPFLIDIFSFFTHFCPGKVGLHT